MALATKTVSCKCGHSFETQREKSWCEKCCRPVFYDSKDQTRHMINTVYLVTVIMGVMMFVTYLFTELIATPLLSFL